ncbi:MAG: M42 family metallopeptidase [Halanaerobiales bacterium]
MTELLKKVTSIFGPAGNEEKIKNTIKNIIKDNVDKTYTDKMGNLIAVKKGNGTGKKIMLAAHMDQIGLMITHIDKNGFLRFTNIGGVDYKILTGKTVTFADGTIGTIGQEKIDDIKELKMSKLYIDIGASNREEAEKTVSIGDPAVYTPNFTINNDRLISSYFDDRIGCYILIKLINNIKTSPHDLYFVFTVQEEVGARGAKTAAYHLNPDIGFAVDVTATGDTPEAHTMDVSLGEGTAIKIKDKSSITHPEIKNLLINTAQKNNIKYQLEVLEYGGTDAGNIHLSRGGVPSGTISVPCRYVHTPAEVIDFNDVNASINLLEKVLKNNISF